MSNQVVKFCKLCNKPTMHIQPSTTHLLHLALSILTLGFWLIIWILTYANNNSQSQCSICGQEKGVFGSTRGGAAQDPTPETHVKCPDCAELIRKEARKCKHCGCSLVPQ